MTNEDCRTVIVNSPLLVGIPTFDRAAHEPTYHVDDHCKCLDSIVEEIACRYETMTCRVDSPVRPNRIEPLFVDAMTLVKARIDLDCPPVIILPVHEGLPIRQHVTLTGFRGEFAFVA